LETEIFIRLIILVPHRDALKPFEDYRQRLFSAGVEGAYSFPLAAPLAQVSRPFSRPELKELAGTIRNLTTEGSGKIHGADEAVSVSRESTLSFYGPALDIPPIEEILFPLTAKAKLLHIMNPPLLCVALAGSERGEKNSSFEKALRSKTIKPPTLVFRAAYLANLAIRPLAVGEPAFSFEWKIGQPVWLPAYPKSTLAYRKTKPV
jgi:hypothetical protein